MVNVTRGYRYRFAPLCLVLDSRTANTSGRSFVGSRESRSIKPRVVLVLFSAAAGISCFRSRDIRNCLQLNMISFRVLEDPLCGHPPAARS